MDPRATALFVESRIYEGFDIEHTLDRVFCPALLLAGDLELGGLIRNEDLEFFLTHTAHGRASRISGGGHGIVEGEPAAIVNTEVVGFLGAP